MAVNQIAEGKVGSVFFFGEVPGRSEIPNLDCSKRTVVLVALSILLLSFFTRYVVLFDLLSFRYTFSFLVGNFE